MGRADYAPAIVELLAEERLNPLDPGEPNRAVQGKLADLDAAAAFAPYPIKDHDMAAACLAGLWLYHSFLDESHKISQEIHTPTGSYWHGLMHRREPDFSNSGYWFRRVGRHAIFEPLHAVAVALARESSQNITIPKPWDPFWFIDYCEACLSGRERGELLARQIQLQEWRLLFGFCYGRAVGSAP
jgi:hypothetical protein